MNPVGIQTSQKKLDLCLPDEKKTVSLHLDTLPVPKEAFLVTHIDPAGGGQSSLTSAMTFLCTPSTQVLVGWGSCPFLQVTEAERACKEYFSRLARVPGFREKKHYLSVDPTYGGELMRSSYMKCARQGWDNLLEKDLPVRLDQVMNRFHCLVPGAILFSKIQ